jgi:hypothetical protein
LGVGLILRFDSKNRIHYITIPNVPKDVGNICFYTLVFGNCPVVKKVWEIVPPWPYRQKNQAVLLPLTLKKLTAKNEFYVTTKDHKNI